MPTYEYACTWCGESVEKRRSEKDRHKYPLCPVCGAACDIVPSLTASRRDHTVNP